MPTIRFNALRVLCNPLKLPLMTVPVGETDAKVEAPIRKLPNYSAENVYKKNRKIETFGGELRKKVMIDQTHGIVGEPAPEPGKDGMIGRALIKGKTKKLLEGDPVVALGFQFRIGVDLKPLLEQEAFHEDQRRICLITPVEIDNFTAVYHLYVVRVKKKTRQKLQDHLQSRGISTGIHYPITLPNLLAYAYLGHSEEDFPEATKASQEIVSLPMFPELSEKQIQYVTESIKECL